MEKIIHQIWIGPYELPERELAFSNKIKEAHPDFEYVFWDKIPQLPSELQILVDYYTLNKQWILIADLLRYYIINEYGGIYIDCDYELINSIHSLNLQNYRGFLPLHYNPEETICNSVFGFEKNHPIINAVCQKLKLVKPNYDNWLGPHFFGGAIKQHLGYSDNDTDIKIDAALAINGIKTMHSRGEFKINYLLHHYHYTWHPENQLKMKLK